MLMPDVQELQRITKKLRAYKTLQHLKLFNAPMLQLILYTIEEM